MKLKYILVVGAPILFALLVAHNGCSKYKTSTSEGSSSSLSIPPNGSNPPPPASTPPPSSTPPPMPTPPPPEPPPAPAPPPPLVADGIRLYAVHCASCHMPYENSTKRVRNYTQVLNSIKFIPQMKDIPTLVALSDAEIRAISEALSVPIPPPQPPPPDPIKPSVTYQQPLGNRLYVASKLKTLFSGGNATIDAAINAASTNLAPIFGGPCNRTVPECGGAEELNQQAPGLSTGNVLRSGYRVKVCEAVLVNDVAITNMLSQVNLTITSPRSRANVANVFETLTSVNITDPIYSDFAQLDALVGNATDSWRLILLSICKSNLFENF